MIDIYIERYGMTQADYLRVVEKEWKKPDVLIEDFYNHANKSTTKHCILCDKVIRGAFNKKFCYTCQIARKKSQIYRCLTKAKKRAV